MNKQTIIKLIVFGVLQWICLNIALFVVSLLFGVKDDAEMTAPPTLGFVIVAVLLVGISFAFARWLKPASRKQSMIAGLLWSGMTTVFLLATVFANDTQGVFFNGWGVYSIFVAQAIGAMLFSPKKTIVSTAPPVS